MSPRLPGFVGRYIVVADEDKAVVGLVIETLLTKGHAVFYAYDGVSAIQLALGSAYKSSARAGWRARTAAATAG